MPNCLLNSSETPCLFRRVILARYRNGFSGVHTVKSFKGISMASSDKLSRLVEVLTLLTATTFPLIFSDMETSRVTESTMASPTKICAGIRLRSCALTTTLLPATEGKASRRLTLTFPVKERSTSSQIPGR
jgi:hypothetical protein